MKPVLDTLDDVPEEIHGEYEEKDGKYVLKLDGAPPGFVPAGELAETKEKVSEFRDTTVGLLKGVAEMAGVEEATDLSPLRKKLAQYEGVDPDEYRKLKEQAEELEAKGVKKAGDVNAQIQKALDNFKESTVEPLQKTLQEEREAREAAQRQAQEAHLRETVGKELTKAGAEPEAMDFLIDRARSVFTIEDGEVVAKNGNFSPQTGDPVTVPEWVSSTALKEYGFAFKPSKGGGASGGPGTPDASNLKSIRGADGEELKTEGIQVLQ